MAKPVAISRDKKVVGDKWISKTNKRMAHLNALHTVLFFGLNTNLWTIYPNQSVGMAKLATVFLEYTHSIENTRLRVSIIFVCSIYLRLCLVDWKQRIASGSIRWEMVHSVFIRQSFSDFIHIDRTRSIHISVIDLFLRYDCNRYTLISLFAPF